MKAREDKGAKRINPPYRPSTHRNPSEDIFRSSLTGSLLFPRSLSDSQSYVLNFTNVDRWAKAHAMLRDVRESTDMFAEAKIRLRTLQPLENESHVCVLWTNATAGK